jgi:tRNA A37 threonylcarbamoyladenosine modification protein TsaB
MILFFDNSQNDRVIIKTFDDFGQLIRAYQKLNASSVAVFRFVLNKIIVEKISKLIIVVGPGRFSKIRSAVSLANVLSLVLGVRLIGVKKSETDYDFVQLAKAKGDQMIQPFYGKEANITKPKLKKISYGS